LGKRGIEGRRGGRGELGLATAVDVPFSSKITSEQQSDHNDEDTWRLIVVHAVVDLGEMPNPNRLLWRKFDGSNRLIRRGLIGVIPEFNLTHILKPPSDCAVPV
jgi:hypothetical protein